MKNVYLLALQNTMASTFIEPLEVFYQAGVMWNYYHGEKLTPYFNVNVVTTNGKPFRCLTGLKIVPDGSIEDVKDPDLIIVSSIMDIDKTMKAQGEVVDWLKERHREGSHLAAVCSGAFVLAETGLLDGKSATTHWLFADDFRKRYPEVKLQPEKLITDEGDLYCSGGYNAGIDLSLYLVEKYYGHDVALKSSKCIISDIGRRNQLPYVVFQCRKDHKDKEIAAVQEWIENNFDKNITYEGLAKKSGMSRRTLERRFKTATGETPLTYQQAIRVEAAKRLLESGNNSFDEITFKVGYEDSSTFRKVFYKQTRLRPSEYRRKFQSA